MGGLLSCMRLVEVIRLVHINGHVEEMSKPVKVEEVMRANPQYYVGHACYHQTEVLPPDARLELGQIYFLLPADVALTSSRPLCSPLSTSPSPGSALSSPRGTPLRLLSPNLAHSSMNSTDQQGPIMHIGLAAPPTFHLRQGERLGVAKVLSLSKKSLSDYLAELDEVKVSSHDIKNMQSVGYGRLFAAAAAEMESLQEPPSDSSAWRPSLCSIAEETRTPSE